MPHIGQTDLLEGTGPALCSVCSYIFRMDSKRMFKSASSNPVSSARFALTKPRTSYRPKGRLTMTQTLSHRDISSAMASKGVSARIRHSTSTRCRAANTFLFSGKISRGAQARPFRALKSGWVAVENTTVVWYRPHSSFTARSVAEVRSAGRLWASSNITTLFAILWSFRQTAGRSENRDSKNRTEVVIMTGELHLAANSRALSGRLLWLWSISTLGMI